ncbi:hypothetical protein T439DRAFT_321720 [Meredithblackwellia eburnea MCA 4105]
MSAASTSKDPLSGHPGHLSKDQEATLAKLREQLCTCRHYDPEKFDDPALLRFLRARNFDLEKSKAMWIAAQDWRESFKVDDLYHHFDYREKPEVMKYYPRFFHKTDKIGRPLCIESFAKLDVQKLFQCSTPERQLQALVVEYECILRDRLPACSDAAGGLIETTCSILDVKNVSLKQFLSLRHHVQELLSISQDHYPELAGTVLVINAPWAVATIWGFVKGYLAEATVAKIQILGSDYQESIFKYIPRDSVPKAYGGTCECPEGCALSDAGPWQGKVRQRNKEAAMDPCE